jgi:pimeloyl-ACP methyl ester carboxylesterase
MTSPLEKSPAADDPRLPPAVTAALWRLPADPGERSATSAAGIPFSSLAWGDRDDRPLILIHGVTASARIWWRIGPALAASRRRVVAVDLPGHGLTGHWIGHHRIRDTAADVAAWIRAAALDVPEVQVVGHSWGAVTAAALPIAGIRPATLVLLDPPAIPLSLIALMASDRSQVPDVDQATARARLSAENPTWSEEDLDAKAEAVLQLDVDAARAVVTRNGDWDAGLADLADPGAAGVPVRIIRGDPTAGSLLPDAALAAFVALVGGENVATISRAPHAPQRTHPVETTAAILAALR